MPFQIGTHLLYLLQLDSLHLLQSSNFVSPTLLSTTLAPLHRLSSARYFVTGHHQSHLLFKGVIIDWMKGVRTWTVEWRKIGEWLAGVGLIGSPDLIGAFDVFWFWKIVLCGEGRVIGLFSLNVTVSIFLFWSYFLMTVVVMSLG